MGAVSYLNTKPLIYGFEKGMMKDDIDLIFDYPANIAQLLLNDEIDIGLVPVAALIDMQEYYIVTDYCIGSEGEVASVCLFSEVPLNEITTVLLDDQSRTSVALAKILMKEFWKIDPIIKQAGKDFREYIKGTAAAIVIGDRAFEQRQQSAYIYDLAAAWYTFTGLPFVFAAWVSNKPLTKSFIQSFNDANAYGLKHLDEVIALNPFDKFDLKSYYTQFISYTLTDQKRIGLKKFLGKLPSKADNKLVS